ncbi:TWiK family of potassium channels protein 18 [Diplonema papillatum]|nr:TWiK family of potassium channels protein 18 [Diplonema papillatum]
MDTDSTLRMMMLLVVQYLVILTMYLALGGGVLSGLESLQERQDIQDGEVILQLANLTQAQRRILQDSTLCHFRSLDDREWTFSGATFFSLTVVTTIGYGNIAPVTNSGRVFTLIYSILGIGLVAHVVKKLSTLGICITKALYTTFCGREEGNDRLSDDGLLSNAAVMEANNVFDRFDADGSGTIDREELGCFLCALSGEKVDPLVVQYVMNEADTDPDGVLTRGEMVEAVTVYYKLQPELPHHYSWRGILVGSLIMFIWLLSWAAAFMGQEGWDYREGFWYCYVTLTTIGFGDYHPRSLTGKVMAFFFIIPGLSIVGWFLNAVWLTSQAKRYWLMQHAYAKGKISEKMLEAQGMRPLFRKGKTSPFVDYSSYPSDIEKIALPFASMQTAESLRDLDSPGRHASKREAGSPRSHGHEVNSPAYTVDDGFAAPFLSRASMHEHTYVQREQAAHGKRLTRNPLKAANRRRSSRSGSVTSERREQHSADAPGSPSGLSREGSENFRLSEVPENGFLYCARALSKERSTSFLGKTDPQRSIPVGLLVQQQDPLHAHQQQPPHSQAARGHGVGASNTQSSGSRHPVDLVSIRSGNSGHSLASPVTSPASPPYDPILHVRTSHASQTPPKPRSRGKTSLHAIHSTPQHTAHDYPHLAANQQSPRLAGVPDACSQPLAAYAFPHKGSVDAVNRVRRSITPPPQGFALT